MTYEKLDFYSILSSVISKMIKVGIDSVKAAVINI